MDVRGEKLMSHFPLDKYYYVVTKSKMLIEIIMILLSSVVCDFCNEHSSGQEQGVTISNVTTRVLFPSNVGGVRLKAKEL